MATINENGHWLTPTGEAVPKKFVPRIDQKRDAMVQRLFKQAEETSRRLRALRQAVDDEVADFLAQAAKEHNLVPNQGGNYWFTGFSGDLRIEIKIGKFIDFDERIKFAKQKIDECLGRWSEGADEKLKVIVFDAFKADQKGRLDTKRILGLRKLEIKDAVWKEAMELISKSISITGTKAYANFYRREAHGEWQCLPLDMARV